MLIARTVPRAVAVCLAALSSVAVSAQSALEIALLLLGSNTVRHNEKHNLSFAPYNRGVMEVQGRRVLLMNDNISTRTVNHFSHYTNEYSTTYRFRHIIDYLNRNPHGSLTTNEHRKRLIAEKKNLDPNNPYLVIRGGNAPADRLFLPSSERTSRYFYADDMPTKLFGVDTWRPQLYGQNIRTGTTSCSIYFPQGVEARGGAGLRQTPRLNLK